MKKTALALALLALFALSPFAQDKPSDEGKKALIAPNIVGAIFGYYSANVELRLSDQLGIEIEPGFFNMANVPFLGSAFSDSGGVLWFGNCKLGVNYYTKETFKGLFAGGFVKGTFFEVGDKSNPVSGGAGGLGAKLGYRWTGPFVSFAMGATYEYNMAFISMPNLDDSATIFKSQLNGGNPGAFAALSFVL